LWRIYWKHCAAFHFAHKPLCGQYRADLLHLRGFWLCRSCCLLWLGVALGALSWLWLPVLDHSALLKCYLAGLGLTILFSLPLPYKRLPRAIRDLLRLCGGLSIALAPYIALRVNLWIGLASICAILLFRYCYLRSRLRRSLTQCRSCPAIASPDVICRGFARQHAGLSAYQAEATAFLYASDYVPPGLSVQGK
jgi:hypothetical protein